LLELSKKPIKEKMSKKNREPEIKPLDPWAETTMDLRQERPSNGFVDHSSSFKVIEEREVARIIYQRGLLNDEQLKVFEEGVSKALLIPLRYRTFDPTIIEGLMDKTTEPYREIIGELQGEFYAKHQRT